MHLYDHKLSYFSVPKCANTSVKTMLFEIKNGCKFELKAKDGKWVGIHKLEKNLSFAKQPHDAISDHRRFTVLRSPEERVFSFYGDKFQSNELKRRNIDAAFRENGLAEDPTLDEFVEHIEEYRDAHAFMYQHLCPLSYYLSDTPEYFDRIFRVADLHRLPEYLAEIVSKPIEMPHLRRRAHRYKGVGLSDAQIKKIRDVYAEDYDIFGQYF